MPEEKELWCGRCFLYIREGQDTIDDGFLHFGEDDLFGTNG